MSKLLYLQVACLLVMHVSQAQGVWEKKADFPELRDMAVAFSIEGFGYVGTGTDTVKLTNDFWKYDPVDDTWEEVASMPTLGRRGAFCFVIDNKAYVGGGVNENMRKDNEFWQYDPSTNEWIRKNDLPALTFSQGTLTGFSIDNRGFLLATFNANNFLEYDPQSDSWINMANFPGQGRIFQVGFTVGAKAYFGLGFGMLSPTSELWEYDPTTNQWSQKTDFPGVTRDAAVGFGIENIGMIGLGINQGVILNDFWEYNPTTDSWRQIESCGYHAFDAFAMTIDSKGYVGTGVSITGREFWEYTPNLSSVNQIEQLAVVNISPNPATNTLFISPNDLNISAFTIFNASGKLVQKGSYLGNTINISGLPQGIFILQLQTNNKVFSKKFVKN